jgi:hypothetical protein
MCTDVVSRTSAAGIVDTNLGRSVAALVANVQSGSPIRSPANIRAG